MGRNTDKLYVTHSEHSGIDGRYSASTGISHKKIDAPNRKLPYIYCALTLQPWEHPVCAINQDGNTGTIFDLLAIVPWLQNKGTNPVTGASLNAKDLLRLNFIKNEQEEFCDPVTMKVFNDHTHIVAIRTSGNVFAFETIQNLNYKAKSLKDLLTDESFARTDVIDLQNPHQLGGYRSTGNLVQAQQKPSSSLRERHQSPEVSVKEKEAKVKAAREAIERMRSTSMVKHKDRTPDSTAPSAELKKPLPYNAATYSTGYTAASFTSTGMSVSTKDERAILSEVDYLLRPKKVKIKGLGMIMTNYGPLDIELFPEHAPKAVYNFVKLAKSGYYSGLTFHRNIPGFMLQGGDPTGRGNGGKSYFGDEFEDEIVPQQSHDRRGILAMANKGPDTNTSQFFITYDATKHLDKKHTIFGHVIGHMDTLDKLERVPRVGDKPKDPIIMKEIQILIDPFEEHLKKEEYKRLRASEVKEITDDDVRTWTNQPVKTKGIPTVASTAGAVGKYIDTEVKEPFQVDETTDIQDERPAKKLKNRGFGDFSGW